MAVLAGSASGARQERLRLIRAASQTSAICSLARGGGYRVIDDFQPDFANDWRAGGVVARNEHPILAVGRICVMEIPP
jgi:hypothetical protein